MLNEFAIKKFVDKITRKQARIKKIIFPQKSQKRSALVCLKWHEKLFSLHWVWQNPGGELKSAELFTCGKEPRMVFATIAFSYLGIKFKSPEESGFGFNFYNLKNLCPELLKTLKPSLRQKMATA
jgi:hypothetical protein